MAPLTPAAIDIPFGPVFNLGPLPIHWYGIGYAAAFLVVMRVTVPYLASRGLPWAGRYPSPDNNFVRSHTIAYQPAGAYELLISLVLFGLVMWLLRQGLREGTTFAVYLTAYAVSQLLIFFVRDTEPAILFG